MFLVFVIQYLRILVEIGYNFLHRSAMLLQATSRTTGFSFIHYIMLCINSCVLTFWFLSTNGGAVEINRLVIDLFATNPKGRLNYCIAFTNGMKQAANETQTCSSILFCARYLASKDRMLRFHKTIAKKKKTQRIYIYLFFFTLFRAVWIGFPFDTSALKASALINKVIYSNFAYQNSAI